MVIFDRLCRVKALETRGWCVSAMANLSWQQPCQVRLAQAGAVEVCAAVHLRCRVVARRVQRRHVRVWCRSP
jgi:hypothetical protein